MTDELNDIADERARFAECLGGISGKEVVGLLLQIMRRECHVYTTTTSGKQVRLWRGNLIGIPIEVIETNVGNTKFLNQELDYFISNVEWEFSFSMMRKADSFASPKTMDVVNFGGTRVQLTYPKFEGDLDDYRYDMSLIRLMGLDQEVEVAEVMLPFEK
jgi:hypothetical protein